LLCVNSVDRHCALVDYNNTNRRIYPVATEEKTTRQRSNQPEKLFLELASSFSIGEPDSTVRNISEKLREICKNSETQEGWDVSRHSIELWKRTLAERMHTENSDARDRTSSSQDLKTSVSS